MTETLCAASLACEMFKAARSEWLTKEEFESILGIHHKTVVKWVAEYVANGVFVQRKRMTGIRGGVSYEFALAPEWGGQGFGSPQDEPDLASASVGYQTQQTQTGMR